MIFNQRYIQMCLSPVRKIECKVELYEGSTLIDTFSYQDRLKSFDIDRHGENTFFGFGFCQRINVKLLDPKRELKLTTAHHMKVYFNGIPPMPDFYISRVIRDENNNSLSVTGYDKVYNLALHQLSELNLTPPYKIIDVVDACSKFMGMTTKIIGLTETETCFDTEYPEGGNVEGTETIREILDAIAEVTQTIYYLDYLGNLVFRRMNVRDDPDLVLYKKDYFKFDSGDNRRLQSIASVTQLGDDVEAHIEAIGSKYYVRDNPFWELRTDIGDLLQKAIDAVGGFTLNQFDLDWRGLPLFEPGDQVRIETKENNKFVTAYILDDALHYDGSLKEKTKWHYDENDTETAENPNTLGEALNQTYARVDKVNKQADIVANEVRNNNLLISNIQVRTNGIDAAVQQTQKNLNDNVNSMNDTIGELTKKVETKMNVDEVSIAIQKELSNGVDAITTKTGFTFDSEGLKVSKTGSEVSTLITEDGMRISKGNKEMLVANNKGVDATNLHANTYLIIGKNSRIEDMGPSRTAVFWIGG